MSKTVELSLRMKALLVDLVQRFPVDALELGEPLSDEWNQAGERVAEEFLKGFKLPESERDCVALYPRLWGACAFLSNATSFGIELPGVEEPAKALRVLMIDSWEKTEAIWNSAEGA